MQINNMNDAWNFINRERKAKKKVRMGVSDEELAQHFMELLEATV